MFYTIGLFGVFPIIVTKSGITFSIFRKTVTQIRVIKRKFLCFNYSVPNSDLSAFTQNHQRIVTGNNDKYLLLKETNNRGWSFK